jgi:hypothetical protein
MMGYKSIDEIFSSGLGPDDLKKAVKDFTASTNKAALEEGRQGSRSSGRSSYEEDSKSLGLDESNAKATTLKGVFDDAATAGSKMLEALNPTDFSGSDYLMKSGQELANQMGIGKARIGEMRTTIADAIPEMLKLGITSTEAFQVLKDVPTSLGVNTTLGTEALREMGAAAQVSGVSTKKLAQEFKEVGMSLYDVGDRMAEVANIAKSVGANVQMVSGLVVDNLKQLNLFNFDTGVKGLAKMASQAAMLGISMEDTFQLADKLMSPEKAIEMSAALQRLGVSSSALLDPLKAMDLAQNDPEALQKEIINVSKEFTKLKADGSGFEIMPGAKRRLREVAEAMGMTASELANMSIKSADLDMKMNKIKFPSLATSEEDKMLIANMAQMKGGEAVLQIKNDITGKMEEINVKDLTADQITKLKEQQADQNKSIEELAIDQLNVLESIDAGINGAKAAVNLGKASTPAIDRFYNTMNVLREESVKVVTSGVNTGNVREGYKGLTQPLESGVIDFLKGNVSLESLTNVVSELTTNVRTTLATIAEGAKDNLINSGQNTVNRITKLYESTGVVPTNITVDQDNPILKKLGEYIDLIKPGVPTETKTQVSGEVNHTLTIKGDGGSSLNETEFYKKVLNLLVDPTMKSEFQKLYMSNNSGLGGKP